MISLLPHLSTPAGPLILVERGEGRFLLSGPQARAHGRHEGGIRRLEGRGTTLLRDLRVDLPPAEEVRVAPHALERSAHAGPSMLERLFIPPDLGGAIVEWRPPSTEGLGPLRLSWIVPDASRWRLHKGTVVVHGTDGATRLFCLPEHAELRARREPGTGVLDLRVDATIGWSGTDAVRFVAAAAGRGRRARLEALRPLRHLGAQQVRARVLHEEDRDEGLRWETPDPRISVALPWAAARLSAALTGSVARRSHSREPDPLAALLVGMGAISLGRFDDAGEAEGAPPVLAPLIARWRGDLASRDAPEAPETLAEILETLGTVDRAPAGPSAPWLAAWHGFESGDVEAGYGALLDLAEAGFGGLSGGWALQEDAFDDPAFTALVPATLVFGLLGARADAHFGRLRLAPCFPAHWHRATVRNLRLGSSLVSLRYERDGGTHVFVLRQTAGATPVNLVFEPSLAVSGVRQVTVDGTPADLEPLQRAGRTHVRLQLPLDSERNVTVVGAD